jgi:hypothetical protein
MFTRRRSKGVIYFGGVLIGILVSLALVLRT